MSISLHILVIIILFFIPSFNSVLHPQFYPIYPKNPSLISIILQMESLFFLKFLAIEAECIPTLLY